MSYKIIKLSNSPIIQDFYYLEMRWDIYTVMISSIILK